VAKEFSELGRVVELYRRFRRLEEEIQQSRGLLDTEEDEEMKRLAKDEVSRLSEEKQRVEEDLRLTSFREIP